MPTKRAIAKADAAELIDIESRLAPFLVQPLTGLPLRAKDGTEVDEELQP